MKFLHVIIFFLLSGFIIGQHKQTGINKNDTLLNLLLQKHLLGAHITFKGQQKHIKGVKIDDTLYIYINNSPRKVSIRNINIKLQKINDSLIHAGYLFNHLEPDSIRMQNKTLLVFYHYNKTVQAKIDSLVVISDKKFPNNIKKRLNKILKAKTIDIKNLNNIERFINDNTGYKIFERPLINFYHGKKMVVLKVKKENGNLLDGMLGFNYDSEKEKLQLEGHIRSSFYNLFNVGDQLSFIWQKKSKYQQIQFNTKIPYIKGSNFTFNNYFSTIRNDTISLEVQNQTNLNYQIHNQTFGINYIYSFKSINNAPLSNRLTGILYHIKKRNQKTTWKAEFQVQFNINISNVNHHLFYSQLKSKEKVSHNISLSHNLQSYIHNQNKLRIPIYVLNRIFRRIINFGNDFSQIYSIKNNIIYHKNRINFYVIADYIQKRIFEKPSISYANTGIGLHFINKNQILTFEIVKPIQIGYSADYQDVYLNFTQTFRF